MDSLQTGISKSSPVSDWSEISKGCFLKSVVRLTCVPLVQVLWPKPQFS